MIDSSLLKKILESVPSCIFFKDTECKYVFATHYWSHLITNGDNWDIYGKTDAEIRVNKKNAEKALEADKEILKTGKGLEYIVSEETDSGIEYLQITKNPVFDNNEKILGIVGLINNITKQVETEQKLNEYMNLLKMRSNTDSLTNLSNRLAFDNYINSVVNNDIDTDYVICMLDVNNLKYVNDSYGHNKGDALIVAAATAINTTFKEYGKSYRVGGDEFAVVMRMPVNVAVLDAELDKNIQKFGNLGVTKLSIARGYCNLVDENGERLSINTWKTNADLNMYKNKASMHEVNLLEENSSLKQFISCLIALVEAKDNYTAYHSLRVQALTKEITKMLGISDVRAQQIIDAASLHDIGKIGIQDIVLCKPGKLTDEEFNIIKKHPFIGAKILSESKYTHDFVEIVLHHHERYDGKGYPSGLAGTDIPLGARILAVADSIDAMTSKRVYRDSLPIEVCKNEILTNSGKMYDPAIVKLVIENWDKIESIVKAKPNALGD